MAVDKKSGITGDGAARARFLLPRCAQLRAAKGVKKRLLATRSGVDTTTLSKVERGEPVTIETVSSIFNALDAIYGSTLNRDHEVEEIVLKPAATGSRIERSEPPAE